MSRSLIMKALREILANEDIIQKVRDSNFDKEVQVRDEINQEELEHISQIEIQKKKNS